MAGFAALGFDPAGFEPVELSVIAGRPWLASQIADSALLSEWTVYAEPPEQLGTGPAIVIAPRTPYQSWHTFRTVSTHLAVSLLVPRAHGPAMDLIDIGLAVLRQIFTPLQDVDIGDVASIGVVDDVGASSYIVATIDVTLT